MGASETAACSLSAAAPDVSIPQLMIRFRSNHGTDNMATRANANCGIERDGKINTIYLYAIVLVATLGGFLFGYDLALICPALCLPEAGVSIDARLDRCRHGQRDFRLSSRAAGRGGE